jgi:hypothetical protein
LPPLGLRGFLELFAGARSLALVGNAETILEHANGPRIDAHDLVVRFNRTYGLHKAPSPAATLRPRCVVCFVEPEPGIELAGFEDWVGELPCYVTLAPDLLKAAQPARTRPVTMGTNALYALTHLLAPERLFLTGFAFYGAAGAGQGVYWEDGRKSRGIFHDLDAEAAIFASIVERFPGAVETTPEVAAVLRRYGGRAGSAASSGGGLAERLYGAAGWRLIRWGMRLRRRAEARARGRIGEAG